MIVEALRSVLGAHNQDLRLMTTWKNKALVPQLALSVFGLGMKNSFHGNN